jgi:DNA modification methylase
MQQAQLMIMRILVARCTRLHFELFSGDKVLDTFLGSGSTLIACERTGRICYGMELEPLYVDIARMRWEAFSGEKAQRSEEEN